MLQPHLPVILQKKGKGKFAPNSVFLWNFFAYRFRFFTTDSKSNLYLNKYIQDIMYTDSKSNLYLNKYIQDIMYTVEISFLAISEWRVDF